MSLRIFKRAQIWWVKLDPAVGSEIQKKRPCVIVSSDGVTRLPVRIVVPLTDWNESFVSSPFHVRVEVDDATAFEATGLKKGGAADIMQIRCVSENRFDNYIALVTAEKMEEIAAAVAAIIEYA
jgi:mRNA interferase MazF